MGRIAETELELIRGIFFLNPTDELSSPAAGGIKSIENRLKNFVQFFVANPVDFDKPVNISRTILENNPVLSKISSNSFRVLVKDADGKTYFGRP